MVIVFGLIKMANGLVSTQWNGYRLLHYHAIPSSYKTYRFSHSTLDEKSCLGTVNKLSWRHRTSHTFHFCVINQWSGFQTQLLHNSSTILMYHMLCSIEWIVFSIRVINEPDNKISMDCTAKSCCCSQRHIDWKRSWEDNCNMYLMITTSCEKLFVLLLGGLAVHVIHCSCSDSIQTHTYLDRDILGKYIQWTWRWESIMSVVILLWNAVFNYATTFDITANYKGDVYIKTFSRKTWPRAFTLYIVSQCLHWSVSLH